MFTNDFKTTWRNLIRNKAFTFINIFGLSLGMALSLLVFLWVHDERQMDNFNASADRIFYVYERVFSNGSFETGKWTPGLLAQELKATVPDIKYASSFWSQEAETLFSVGDKNIPFKGSSADSDFFRIMSFPLLQGSKREALAGPDALAISQKMATAFFGSPEAAFGRTIRYNDSRDFKITAVYQLPANASEQFDFVVNWDFQLKSVTWLYDWINRSPSTIVQLQAGADPARVEARIKDFVMSRIGTYGAGTRVELGLQRYDEGYLHSVYKNGVPDGGRIEYVRLFSAVAIFILIIACINFMNLATARSVKRAKEVGIRKTIGALRFGLVIQFMGEALLLSLFSAILAIAMAALAMPYFNALTEKQLVLPLMSVPFWSSVAGLVFLTGLVAGSYPALFLSSLNPVNVLKGRLRFSSKAVLFRKGLVVFQFTLSIILIISTLVVSKQVGYIQTRNLGFDNENLLYMPYQGNLGQHYDLIQQELSGQPGVKTVSSSTQAPSYIGAHVYDLDWDGKDPDDRIIGFHDGIGYGFLKMMGLTLLQGRDFSRGFPADTSRRNPNLIINETLWKLTGYKDPIGKRLRYFGSDGRIIGVVKDFNPGSLHTSIPPMVLYFGQYDGWGGILVKTEAGKTRQAIASMEKVFKQMEPKFPFRYTFADEEYQKLYKSEQTVSRLSDSFSVLAIFISCLGLLGLAIFTAEQRRKEIGVRKVIGASVADIVAMLSKDIIKLVALAALIATPLAWLFMNSWLDNYAYKISISWWIFLMAGAIALFIALITVSYQAIRAATTNPVKSLRSE